MTCWSLALNTANTIPQHTRPNCTGPSNAFDRSTNAVGGTCRWRCLFADCVGSQSRSAGLVRRSGNPHFRRSILDLSDLFRRRAPPRAAQPVHSLASRSTRLADDLEPVSAANVSRRVFLAGPGILDTPSARPRRRGRGLGCLCGVGALGDRAGWSLFPVLWRERHQERSTARRVRQPFSMAWARRLPGDCRSRIWP